MEAFGIKLPEVDPNKSDVETGQFSRLFGIDDEKAHKMVDALQTASQENEEGCKTRSQVYLKDLKSALSIATDLQEAVFLLYMAGTHHGNEQCQARMDRETGGLASLSALLSGLGE